MKEALLDRVTTPWNGWKGAFTVG